MKYNQNQSIPILYYHSVADHKEKDNWSFLSIQIELFKKQMNYLHKNGFSTCTWDELYDHINGLKKITKKSVMIHFDDGFLDNWTIVFPIMKKLSFHYSILLTPEFIQEGEIRPFTDQSNLLQKNKWWGYLNKKEIKKMSESGLVDFQAHGFTHTWYESSSRLIDIYNGSNFYPHIHWNLNLEKKPYWLNTKLNVKLGYPIFEFKKSLELNNRFILKQNVVNELIKIYDKTKTDQENFKSYQNLLNEKKLNEKIGYFETDVQSNERLLMELRTTKKYIEGITNKPVNYLVFPGGGNSDRVFKLSKKVGYKLVSKGNELNYFNSKVFRVTRFSAFYPFPSIFYKTLNMIFLKLQISRARGNPIIKILIKLLRK